MATDGVKIIDGDYAHDLYNQFMDLYDAGASLAEIETQCGSQRNDADPFEEEIFVTTYALALWQIGELPADLLEETRRIVSREAGVSVFTEEAGPAEGRKRKRELEKLLKRISQPNLKPRKRRVYTDTSEVIFSAGEILIFQLPCAQYCATILLSVQQYRGRCNYQFMISTFKSAQKPTLEDIIHSRVVGRRIWSGATNSGHFITVPDIIKTTSKSLRAYADRFESLDTVTIRDDAKLVGSCISASDFSDFIDSWVNPEQPVKSFFLSELL
ncbi:hypothetical protein IC231_13245 [Hymenobacter sp. BT646]|uniref:Uncharacterized protein n=2 Tax=Hymenobacter duratus TaxID=2771356 RepID=A0ABR8JKV3_9BACT|nr:hypothetical protein [Hymenobacter duratus]